MEFKMLEKWRVQEQLSLTEEQLDLAIHRMIKRHPYEKWIVKHHSLNGEIICYLKLEFIDWLKSVYLNKEGYYIDLEIDFFKKHISRLEEELNIPPREINFKDMSINELCDYFNQGKKCIYSAICRMCQKYDPSCKYKIDSHKIMISKEGVKWLYEEYFREAYLKDLEFYKIELQKRKYEKYGRTR